MRSKIITAIVAVLSCFLIATAGVAVARGLAETKVTIHGQDGDFHGKVKSDKGKCLGDRTVNVYKKTGDTKQKIGSDTSERQGDVGVWSAGNTGFKHGKFFARVKKTDVCAGDRSKTLEL